MHNHNIHSGSRNCIVCGKALEDAVSLSTGWGPACRKKANEVLAKEIPANLALAQTIAATLADAEVPEEAKHTLSTVKADIAAGQTNDWRATVKRCAWLLSFSPSKAFQDIVVSLVAALGYVGLAGLLTGEACTGAARVWFHEGRVYLAGPRNAAGKAAIKAIQGWKFHPAAGETPACWSAPHGQVTAFLGVVAKFWPLAEGAESALDAAELYEPPVAPTPVQSKAQVFVRAVAGLFEVQSPWNPAFVAGVKALPWASRRWNPTAKAWEVSAAHKAALRALIETHYGDVPPALT